MPNALTEAAVKAAKSPPKGTVTIWDESLRNFGVRVSQGGTKTFIVLVASGRRQSIGRYPLISLADARKEARQILAEKELGKVRPKHASFDDAKQQFLDECKERLKPRTYNDYKRLLTKHYTFGRKSVGATKPPEIVKILNGLNKTPSEKHHAFVAGNVFFNWCVRQHLIDTSPMEHISVPPKPSSRDRVLDDDEITQLLAALNSNITPFKRICLLLLYTGQRRSEIAALEWDWIDRDRQLITLPSERTKNGRTHQFPYGTAVAEVLETLPLFKDCPYLFPAARQRNERTTVFNGWGKPKAELDKELPIESWTLHDLRRTVSSGMAALGVPQIVVEKLLNHVSGGSQSPIAQVYNRHAYTDEMHDAVLQWERHLRTLLETMG